MTEPACDLHALAQRSADADLATLIQVKEDARAAMRKDNTAKNIAAFNAAAKALEVAMRKKGQEPPPVEQVPGFSSLEAVRRFLNGQGYVVSKSTIDRHKKEGKIRQQGGVFTEDAALRYAKAFLKDANTGKRGDVDTADQQRRFLTARADKAEQEAALLRLKTLEQEGRYLPREKVQQDLAARAMMLRSGFKHLVQSSVGEWVHLVGGDPAKAPELLREVTGKIERMLSDYAGADSVVLVFDGLEEDGGPEEGAAQEAAAENMEAGNPVA